MENFLSYLKMFAHLKKFIPNWALLKSLESLKLVRTSYIWLAIVPISSKILASTEEVIELTLFGNKFPLAIPFSWEQFFYAALFFTLGNILVVSLAPQPIKSYKGYSEFESEHEGWSKMSSFYKSHYQKLLGGYSKSSIKTLERHYFFTNFGESLFGDNAENVDRLFNNIVSTDRTKLPSAFWWIYDVVNVKWWAIRFLITFVYAWGFYYLGSVMLDNLLFVWTRYPLWG